MNSETEKHWLDRYHIAVYLVVALLSVILLLIAGLLLESGPWQDLLLNLAAGLLGVVLIFFLVDQFFELRYDRLLRERIDSLARDIRQLTETIVTPHVQVLHDRDEVYGLGIRNLNADEWEKVRIFAPVGLWRKDDKKREWLEELRDHADKGWVGAVWAVYGLPPDADGSAERTVDDVTKELKYAYELLSMYDRVRGVMLRYLPPFAASVGFGVLLFERKDRRSGQVGFALARHSHEALIDCGFCSEYHEVYYMTKQWFDEQIWAKTAVRYVLQDDRVSFKVNWPKVVKEWYPEVNVANWEDGDSFS